MVLSTFKVSKDVTRLTKAVLSTILNLSCLLWQGFNGVVDHFQTYSACFTRDLRVLSTFKVSKDVTRLTKAVLSTILNLSCLLWKGFNGDFVYWLFRQCSRPFGSIWNEFNSVDNLSRSLIIFWWNTVIFKPNK